HHTVLALTSIGMLLPLDAILRGFILPSWLLRLQAMPEVSMSWPLYEAFLSFFALNMAIVFTISVLIWKYSQNVQIHKISKTQNFPAMLNRQNAHLSPLNHERMPKDKQ